MLLRHRPICKMADLFPDFSLGLFFFDPDVLYDLENEYENELLASIDIENAVRYNTNNSLIEVKFRNKSPSRDRQVATKTTTKGL